MKHSVVKFRGAEGVSLVADAYGNPASPAVLFMHGGGQTRFSWGRAAQRFADQGYYALTLDLRGHGQSQWSPTGSYDIQHFVDDFNAVLDQLPDNEQLPIVVGASLGGVTALLGVGNAQSPCVSHLVLVDVVPKMNEEGKARITGFMRDNIEGFDSHEHAAEAIARYLPHRPRPKDTSGLKKNLRTGDDGRYYWHWDPEFMSQDKDINEESTKRRMEDASRKIAVPVLLVKGALSEIVDEEGLEHLRQLIPHVNVVDVSEAAHMVAGDNNDDFGAVVLQFLSKNSEV